MATRSFKLTIAYDGTDLAGWQIQPDQPTVQALLQRAVRQVTGESAVVIGSGRTDSGVHAVGQVASLRLENWSHPADRLARAINTKLPDTVVVNEAIEMPVGFHAIRHASGKRYRYQLQLGGTRDAFEHRYRWQVFGRIDIDAMADAATRFVGTHDFASFQATGAERRTTTRTIKACELVRQRRRDDDVPLAKQGRADSDGIRVAIEVEANGFLYNMVRNIVGTILEVGRGRLAADAIADVIAARRRAAAGQAAPAAGLCLLWVAHDPPFD